MARRSHDYATPVRRILVVGLVSSTVAAALLLIIVVSLIPMGVEWLKARRKGADETNAEDAQTEPKAAARAE